jgi:hypothetical protein
MSIFKWPHRLKKYAMPGMVVHACSLLFGMFFCFCMLAGEPWASLVRLRSKGFGKIVLLLQPRDTCVYLSFCDFSRYWCSVPRSLNSYILKSCDSQSLVFLFHFVQFIPSSRANDHCSHLPFFKRMNWFSLQKWLIVQF